MTPQEISDYKRKWLSEGGYQVRLHSDLTDKVKTWCRRNVQRQDWSMQTYTDVYEHTFVFHHEPDALEFERQWPKFTNQ